MRSYVVIGRLDQETEDRMLALRKALTARGFSVTQWPPHVTLAAYENLEAEPLCQWTEAFAARRKKIALSMASLAVLPPSEKFPDTTVFCLSPACSKEFVDFYYAFHGKYEAYCTGIGQYNAISHGQPVLHATLCTVKLAQAAEVLQLALGCPLFGPAQIEALEVYTYPMERIARYPLG